MSWTALTSAIVPFYPKGEGQKCPLNGLEPMPRMHAAPQCFGCSDEGIEGNVPDSQAILGFVGINLSRENMPEATTLPKLCHPLEKHQLTMRIFQSINKHLATKDQILREETGVGASIVTAPSSTNNRDVRHDAKIHKTKKHKRHLGIKAHLGVCADSHFIDEAIKAKNRTKSRICSRVEHSVGMIKRVLGFRKVRYRGLTKNGNRLFMTAAQANIFLLRYSVQGAVHAQ